MILEKITNYQTRTKTDLNRNVEGDGDDGVEDDDVGEEDEERNDGGARYLFFRHHCVPREKNLKLKIVIKTENKTPILFVAVHLEIKANHALPEPAGNCAEEAHGEQEDDNPQDDEVQQLVDRGPLELCLAGILHQFGVFARKQNQTIAPWSVSQHCPSQQHLEGMVSNNGQSELRFVKPFHCPAHTSVRPR